MQPRIISKEEAHKMIDEFPGNGVMLLEYDQNIGISNCGKFVKKNKGKRLVNKAQSLVFINCDSTAVLNLHSNVITDFCYYKRKDIVNSILFPKFE